MGIQPDMRDAVLYFSQEVTLREHTQTVVNGKPVNTYRNFSIMATVQTAAADALKNLIDKIDATKEYITVHTVYKIRHNDEVNVKNKFYKVINVSFFGKYGYGFWKAIAEEIKNSGKI